MYYLGRSYLFQKVGDEYARPSFFEFFKNNTANMINNLFHTNESVNQTQRTYIYLNSRSNLANNPAFDKIIKDAYVHPAEKEYISNPIMIWNDSYSYVKNTRFKSQNPSDFMEYEMFIKRASSKKNERNSLNSLKKGLTEDFTYE